jgi:hypothetical protein
MSLINDALKKAQRQRSSEPTPRPPVPTALVPSTTTASGQYRRPDPLQTLPVRLAIGGAALLGIALIGFGAWWFLVRRSAAPPVVQAPVLTTKPPPNVLDAPVVRPRSVPAESVATHSPGIAKPAPAEPVANLVFNAGRFAPVEPAAAAGSGAGQPTSARTAVPPVPPPVVPADVAVASTPGAKLPVFVPGPNAEAPVRPAAAKPGPTDHAAATKTGSTKPVPGRSEASVAPPSAPAPDVTTAPTPAVNIPVAIPVTKAEETIKPAVAPAVVTPVAAAPVAAAPAVPAAPPKPRPEIADQIERYRIMGIRAAGADSRVLMNDRVIRVGEFVDLRLGLKLVAVEPHALVFAEENGVTYRKGF